jgi:hypothetical protein
MAAKTTTKLKNPEVVYRWLEEASRVVTVPKGSKIGVEIPPAELADYVEKSRGQVWPSRRLSEGLSA